MRIGNEMRLKSDFYYDAVVTNVVDGDTIDATVDLGFNIFQNMRLRLYGIDTKELTSKDEHDRMLANEAKQYVINSILNKHVLLKTYKQDKYGRYLANVYIYNDGILEKLTLNDSLISEGFAVPYFGGTKG